MKSYSKKYPNTQRYIIAIFLFALALFVSTFVNKGVVKQYFPFSAVLLLAIATWYLYKRDNKSLDEIGINFSFKNIALLPLGLLIGAGIFLNITVNYVN